MAATMKKKKPKKHARLSHGSVARLHAENPVLLTEAPKKFSKACYDLLLLWCRDGKETPGGVVVLEHLTIASRLYTTEAAYVRFLEKTNGAGK